MKLRILLLPALLALPLAAAPPLVPLPATIEEHDGRLTLDASSTITAAGEARPVAGQLASWLRPSTGLPLPLTGSGGAIRLALDPALAGPLGAEGYHLQVTRQHAELRAATPAGLFYAAQTLRQLLPPAVFSSKQAAGADWSLPCLRIEDKPRFAWRGFMLDCSRHFMPVDHLRQLIDTMAAHKLNRLHLHLTDDDGWRIEIKAYPKLTGIGAWRGTACPLPNTRKGETFERYGGFYTQQELRELVAYARARQIEIMPEIDLPGHALAITTAYPDSMPTKVPDAVSAQGHKANAISPAREENYRMIETIFTEVADIFPFPFIHIGGDEVNHSLWSECPDIKAWMEREKIPNLHHAQVRFTMRLDKILERLDRRLIGWQEITNDALRRETGIMPWLGAGAGWNAARKGFPVVMAPGAHCYFDMPYPDAHDEPPSHWWAGPVGIERCYAFDPLGGGGAELDDQARARILGVHSALWSEFVTPWKAENGWLNLPDTGACADYKTWPRLCALAEMAWTPQDRRDFDSFRARLGPAHFQRLAAAGIPFRLEPSSAVVDRRQIRIVPAYPGATVRFTTDGSDPHDSATAETWDGSPIDGAKRSGLRMRTTLPGTSIVSPQRAGARIPPAGHWSTKGWQAGESKVLAFDLDGLLAEPGVWRAKLRKTKGKSAPGFQSCRLLAGTTELLRADPAGSTALLVVESLPADATPTLELALVAPPEGHAEGELLLEWVAAELPPEMTVETDIGHYASHSTDLLLDLDPATYFWSNRHLEDGDTLTWVLAESTAASHVELQTGAPNGTKDQLLDAVLEVSTDGTTFRQLSGFQYGRAGGNPGDTPLKAIRLRATKHSPGWAIVQDLVIETKR